MNNTAIFVRDNLHKIQKWLTKILLTFFKTVLFEAYLGPNPEPRLPPTIHSDTLHCGRLIL